LEANDFYFLPRPEGRGNESRGLSLANLSDIPDLKLGAIDVQDMMMRAIDEKDIFKSILSNLITIFH